MKKCLLVILFFLFILSYALKNKSLNNNCTVCIVSIATKNIFSYAQHSFFLLSEYAIANHYCYDFRTDQEEDENFYSGDIRWNKVGLLKNVVSNILNESNSSIEIVVWIDADIIITDFNFSLEAIPYSSEKDIFISRNYEPELNDEMKLLSTLEVSSNSGIVNTGIVIVRTTNIALQILIQWWKMDPYNGMDQHAFTVMLQNSINNRSISDYVQLLPSNILGSRIPARLYQHEGDAILHLACEPNGYRELVFRVARGYYLRGQHGDADAGTIKQFGLRRDALSLYYDQFLEDSAYMDQAMLYICEILCYEDGSPTACFCSDVISNRSISSSSDILSVIDQLRSWTSEIVKVDSSNQITRGIVHRFDIAERLSLWSFNCIKSVLLNGSCSDTPNESTARKLRNIHINNIQNIVDVGFELFSLFLQNKRIQNLFSNKTVAFTSEVDVDGMERSFHHPVLALLHTVSGEVMDSVIAELAILNERLQEYQSALGLRMSKGIPNGDRIRSMLGQISYYKYKYFEFLADYHFLNANVELGIRYLEFCVRVWLDELDGKYNYYGSGNNYYGQYKEGLIMLKRLAVIKCSDDVYRSDGCALFKIMEALITRINSAKHNVDWICESLNYLFEILDEGLTCCSREGTNNNALPCDNIAKLVSLCRTGATPYQIQFGEQLLRKC